MARTISRRSATPTASQYTPEPETDDEATERTASARRHPARTPSQNKRDTSTSSATGGWGGYNAEKKKGGKSYGDPLKVSTKAQIIAFLQSDPFAVYREHWIAGEGRQSYTCHGTEKDAKGKEVNICPLCEVDQKKPALRVLFNVVDFSDGDPKVVVLRAGVQLSDLIYDWAQNDKSSPIDRFGDPDGKPDLYWSIKRLEKQTGGRTKYDYFITPVKDRDLDEWDIEPLTAEERDALMANLFTAETQVRIDPVEDLEELADGLAA
ncbi:hypothetical protein ACIBCT_35580 [Streptosporangium sp. NPDC050855]|uniref:hypothetical protein n=1 Tax=Streptosporangium sp. NPDC050855 TaxID=3366194 RepID=UPI0037BD90C2